jgi:hypothetical protein
VTDRFRSRQAQARIVPVGYRKVVENAARFSESLNLICGDAIMSIYFASRAGIARWLPGGTIVRSGANAGASQRRSVGRRIFGRERIDVRWRSGRNFVAIRV